MSTTTHSAQAQQEEFPTAVMDGLSMAESAYRRLRDRLVTLDIAPGEAMNESTLAAELGVGRTPLREAIKRLEADFLVITYPRRGTFASPVDMTELADLTEMRLLLEPMAARKAAVRLDDARRERLQQALHLVHEGIPTGDRRRLIRTDLVVHRAIYAAAGNMQLEETLIRLDNLATRIWCMVLDRIPDIESHVGEHVGMLEAVLGGDAPRAEQLALEHVRHFEAAVRSTF